ncbi:hypothetical protein PUN28_008659 [Cardiocondyla obscurior]
MRIDETQDQYNECFTQATNQDILLDTQRDAIESLHKRIRCLECDKHFITSTFRAKYYSILSRIQEQVRNHVIGFQELKWKMDHFVQSKNYSKSIDIGIDGSSKINFEDKSCDTRDLEHCTQEREETKNIVQKGLLKNDQETEENLSELNISEHEMLTVLCDRVHSLKVLLQEKLENMVKLQADYELLKNENSILRSQNDIIKNETKNDIYQLKEKLKETRIKLLQTEDNCQQITEDFNNTQKQLLSAKERDVDLQESLKIMKKDYDSKIIELECETVRLHDLMHNLTKELEDAKKTLASKNIELCQMQDKCKSYTDHLDVIRQDLKKEKEELTKVEHLNRDLIQQLQEYMKNSFYLNQQKVSLEQNNSTYINELQKMRKSLLDLEKECYLKDQSLTHMSADLTETAMSRLELCKESRHILSCIRDCMEEQKKYNKALTKNLENKQQLLMQLISEKKALLIKIKKMKRNSSLAQKLKKTHKLTGKSLRKTYINNYRSSSITAHRAMNMDLISHLSETDLHEKYLMKLGKSGRCTSSCGNSWWFPKMEHLINEVQENNRWWNKNSKNETESDTSMEESRDYGYQSSSTTK